MPLSVNNHKTNNKYTCMQQFLTKGLEKGIYLKHEYTVSKKDLSNFDKSQNFSYYWCNNNSNADNFGIIEPKIIQTLLKPDVFNELITTNFNYCLSTHGYFDQLPTLKKNINQLSFLRNKLPCLLIIAINLYFKSEKKD